MKKIIALLLVGLTINVAYADGWRGGGRWGGGEGWRGGEGDGMGWAIGSALVGGVVGAMMANQGPTYVQPAPVMAYPGYPPPVYGYPQPVYGYPQPVYGQPMYPAPYYYGGRGWDDD